MAHLFQGDRLGDRADNQCHHPTATAMVLLMTNPMIDEVRSFFKFKTDASRVSAQPI